MSAIPKHYMLLSYQILILQTYNMPYVSIIFILQKAPLLQTVSVSPKTC